jgi:hypothetical protein
MRELAFATNAWGTGGTPNPLIGCISVRCQKFFDASRVSVFEAVERPVIIDDAQMAGV